ncbi:hypothetical protein V6N13_050376 [Hibiscus sabdariffa]|uniref:Uncharacterized protein n=1 Tax=Hibiscus sabdariffa TaxID=183260 RepID=A0ABR2P4V0_9ROSI
MLKSCDLSLDILSSFVFTIFDISEMKYLFSLHTRWTPSFLSWRLPVHHGLHIPSLDPTNSCHRQCSAQGTRPYAKHLFHIELCSRSYGRLISSSPTVIKGLEATLVHSLSSGSTMPIPPQCQKIVVVPYHYRRAELRGDKGP